MYYKLFKRDEIYGKLNSLSLDNRMYRDMKYMDIIAREYLFSNDAIPRDYGLGVCTTRIMYAAL